MLPVVLREVGKALSADASAVILFEHRENSFFFALADGVLAPNTGLHFSVENSISGMVMQNRKPYATTDLASDNNRSESIRNYLSLGPAVLVPLQSETEFLGCLLCARNKDAVKGEFSSGEIQLLTSIGEMVGTALRRARLYDDALLRLRRVQGLHTIDVAMSSNMDLNVTLYILLNQSLSLMEMDAVDILTFNPVVRTLNYTAGRGFRTTYMEHVQLRLGEGVAGRAALERKSIAVTDISSEPNISRSDIIKKEGFQSLFVAPMVTKGQMRGVLELYSRRKFNPNSEWMEFFEALASQTAIAMDAAQLYHELQRSNLELSMAYDATIEGWSHALDLKDKETEGHTLRVTDWTVRLATLAGIEETEIVHLRRGALLHDIGKLGIPDHILGKTGKLTEDEWEIMRRHTLYGYNMLHPIEFLRPAIDIPYYHHEKWDGTGYPQGLAGEQIPYAARLFAIVDVWDAITSDRPYRKAWSVETAIEYIRSEKGKHFDPAIVDLFLKLVDELRATPPFRP
jgi:HD-GYP domain-containing protein (c-di-GMP phosphodiesterase class II)